MTRIRINLPDMYPRQRELLFHPARFVWIEGSTKSGKTAGCMTWQLAQVLENTGIHWWVAPIYEQAKIAYRRVLKDFEPLILSSSQSPMVIKFRSGPGLSGVSEWHFKSADNPDSLYGEETQSIVVDEASRTKEDTWTAVRSTLSTTRGPARVIGNVRGRGNWHYRQCRLAESGKDPEHFFGRLVAQDAVDGGVLDPDELAQARRDLPAEAFGELYECRPADDAYNPFGLANIAACVGDVGSDKPVVWGLDIARKKDWTVLVGLDAKGRVSRMGRWQGDWIVIEEQISEMLKTGIRKAPVLADATGVGDAIVGNLQRRKINVHPFIFTPSTKQDIMQGLRVALMDRAITIPGDGPLRAELDVFEYLTSGTRVVYGAPDKMHDDCVCALALAVHMGTMLTSKVRRAAKPSAVEPVAPAKVAAPIMRQVRNARRFR